MKSSFEEQNQQLPSSHSDPNLLLLGKTGASMNTMEQYQESVSDIEGDPYKSNYLKPKAKIRYHRQQSSPAKAPHRPVVLPGQSFREPSMASPVPPPPDSMSSRTRARSELWASPNTCLADLKAKQRKLKLQRQASRIFDDPLVTAGYASVKLLDQEDLPRGGISVETSSVGRIQFGIPPETIKDSMMLGMEVPRIYIVPTERFCSDWGTALGINLAEFEFPAYFNWFVRRKKCCLVVDSVEAEQNIRSVFEETLLGPKKFRDPNNPVSHDEDDFDPDFPVSARPNFYKEFEYFRVSEKTDRFEELTTDMLLDFYHFERGLNSSERFTESLSSIESMLLEESSEPSIGIPPVPSGNDLLDEDDEEEDEMIDVVEEKDVEDPSESLHRSIGDFRLSDKELGGTNGSETKKVPTQSRKPKKSSRRSSLESLESMFSSNSKESIRSDQTGTPQQWLYSQVQWLGQLVTVWPMDATPEEIEARSVPRAEIFKMPGSGTEYVIHDVDKDNTIIGKARLKGNVRVPEKISVEGFSSPATSVFTSGSKVDEEASASSLGFSQNDFGHSPQRLAPKALFHPPSFGLTVLGNSHGFDKKGSTSGYVLWINGRGIMIDPPPYSSAALEREGIRPQMIFGLIITHCHADHDAGAFQKVLTGSRLTIITTPTIYTSFIRKYSALSGLSPSLLKRSHRFRRGLIGQPLRFQGAVFHFTYTLHTIPCISFKVEWRGRSIVFTGDHLNNPPLLDELEAKGTLSKGRAASLRQMPLQQCNLLLHESGAPPIHTPLAVLQNLPQEVKDRLYVVHTSALPEDCGLRVAPTGTAGTLRLDEDLPKTSGLANVSSSLNPWKNTREGPVPSSENDMPLVMQRPACVSDAWFMLNLISNIPFIANLTYINTMEVLEVASIYVIDVGEVVVPARKRHDLLCVVWEGTCIERVEDDDDGEGPASVWHAGDWSGPVILQPSLDNAASNSLAENNRDVIALSHQGVKVITIAMADIDKILMRGSKLYRQYLESTSNCSGSDQREGRDSVVKPALRPALDTLKINSLLGHLHARQVRSLESLAEGPRYFQQGSYLWRAGGRCDYAFLVISGMASFQAAPGRTRSIGNGRRNHRQGSSRSMMENEYGQMIEVHKMITDLPPESEFARLETSMGLRANRMKSDPDYRNRGAERWETSDRNVNKLLARLNGSKKCIEGLLVSRGCFLSNTSTMVAGHLVHESGGSGSSAVQHLHSTTLVAGPEGCVTWVFPRSTFIPFLDNNPGVLLSLLGTQVLI